MGIKHNANLGKTIQNSANLPVGVSLAVRVLAPMAFWLAVIATFNCTMALPTVPVDSIRVWSWPQNETGTKQMEADNTLQKSKSKGILQMSSNLSSGQRGIQGMPKGAHGQDVFLWRCMFISSRRQGRVRQRMTIVAQHSRYRGRRQRKGSCTCVTHVCMCNYCCRG